MITAVIVEGRSQSEVSRAYGVSQPWISRLIARYRAEGEAAFDTGSLTVRHAGRLHHIGVGRAYARTHVLMLIHDRDVRIINAATGELLRELTIDPTRDYQPRNVPCGRPKKKP